MTRSDLLDRALILKLHKIEDHSRREEDELWPAFEEARPAIFGALLDLAAGALRRLPEVVLTRKPRMADFGRLGVAVERTRGLPPGTFLGAYTRNRSVGNEIAIEASLIGPFIRTLAAQPGGWQSSPQALLNKLDEMYERARSGLSETSSACFTVPGHGTNRKKPRGWPTNAQQLSVKIQRIAPNLTESGVEVEMGQTAGPGSTRFIRLFSKPPSSTTTDPAEGGDETAEE